MSRVITFSRFFPATHPRKGEPTFFAEQLLNSITPRSEHGIIDWSTVAPGALAVINDFFLLSGEQRKHHTIRSGHRWKVGDKFSPRIWSGKPYASKQIEISGDIEIVKTWEFKVYDGLFYLDGKWIDVTSCDIPKNDGLSCDDFLNWFPVNKNFDGQVICWNEDINY